VNKPKDAIANNWPRLPSGKIDYDAWIKRIQDKWGAKPVIKNDLTKVF
jgi:hypothetical protein